MLILWSNNLPAVEAAFGSISMAPVGSGVKRRYSMPAVGELQPSPRIWTFRTVPFFAAGRPGMCAKLWFLLSSQPVLALIAGSSTVGRGGVWNAPRRYFPQFGRHKYPYC